MVEKLAICSECQSDFFLKSSEMLNLCPNCAHYLYGYPNCKHQFENGRCVNCYWDGKTSKFIDEKI